MAGTPAMAHRGIADPSAAVGSRAEIARAFHEAFATPDRRVGLLLSLPLSTLDAVAKQTGA